MELVEEIGAVVYLRNSEYLAQTRGGLDGGLMSDNVSEFVGNDTGQFIVTLSQSHDFAGHVDSSAGNTEGVHFGKFNKIKTKLQLGWGQVLSDALSQCAQVGIEGVVMNDLHVLRQALGHGIAKVDLLLVGENIGFVRDRLNGGW